MAVKKTTSTGSSFTPILIIFTFLYRRCGKRFYTKFGYILTLHFVHMMAEVDAGASIEIRDGSDDTNANLIKVIEVKNYTRPESVYTTGNNMFIVFKAKKEIKSEIFLEITAGPSRAYDLNVTQSLIKGNSGRGECL